MTTAKTVLIGQYTLVKEARQVMFNFCAGLDPADLIRSTANVGNGGSIRNLMVHVGNSYYGWLSHFAFQQPFNKKPYESATTLDHCKEYFIEVDGIVAAFLDAFENDYEQALAGSIANRALTATPLQLFTHVVTHEFHHKGQVLALARLWGYTPVDTDIIR